jgi:hypothetical protein
MIMPGRSWVAGIDIAVLHLLQSAGILDSGAGRSGFRRTWNQPSILHREDGFWELERLQVLLQ